MDYSYRERVHNYEMHTYMYGQVIRPPPGITNGTLGGENPSDLVLSPSSTVINFGDLQIYRVGSGAFAGKSVYGMHTIKPSSRCNGPVRRSPSGSSSFSIGNATSSR